MCTLSPRPGVLVKVLQHRLFETWNTLSGEAVNVFCREARTHHGPLESHPLLRMRVVRLLRQSWSIADVRFELTAGSLILSIAESLNDLVSR
eukprot:3121260-Amphidinium_carterae.2